MSQTSSDPQIVTLHHQLMGQPVWQAVADTERIVSSAVAIQQIPAPTFDEVQRARYVFEQMQALGLDQVQLDDLHNVYGCLPGRNAGPGVLVTAHIDTVFARDVNLQIQREGSRIYGPGLGDNSISVAAMLHLAGVIRQHGIVPERTLWFVANTGEEGLGNLRGMRAVIDRLRDQVAEVIVVDAEYGTVVHAGVASRRFRVSVEAAGGHSWQDFGAPSAVHVLVRLAARLTELRVPVEPRTTFNIGVIDGGTTINAIAQHANLLLDLRSVDQGALNEIVLQAEEIVADVRVREQGVTIKAEVVGDRPGGSIDTTHPLVKLASAAYAMVGADVTLDAASTDANVPLSRGIPSVCVGMCRSGNAHRLDEYLDTDDIPAGMQALLLLTLGTASESQPA